MKILALEPTKQFVKVDFNDDDDLIISLIEASERKLYNATGVEFDSTNPLAVLYCKVLVKDWYENRELMVDEKTSNKVRYTLQSILLQLKCEGYSDV